MRRASLVGSLAAIAIAAGGRASSARDAAASPTPSPTSPPALLTVSTGAPGEPWTLRVENTGERPFRLVADPRLLSLEIEPPHADEPEPESKRARSRRERERSRTVRCVLPADARPAVDDGRGLVVPGQRSWTATFDPLFYCFGARERAALVPGATVTAHFGFPPPPSKRGKPQLARAPFVVDPVGAGVGHFTPAKELETAPFVLNQSARRSPDGGTPGEIPLGSSPISVAMPQSLDAARGVRLRTTVRVTNESKRSRLVLARPETLGFSVDGPNGHVECGRPHASGSPIRELFTTLGPHRHTSVSLLIDAVCPPGTFDDAGLYRVVPRLDTTGVSGRAVGIHTWDGAVTGDEPMLVRIRSPRRADPRPPPRLDPKRARRD